MEHGRASRTAQQYEGAELKSELVRLGECRSAAYSLDHTSLYLRYGHLDRASGAMQEKE